MNQTQQTPQELMAGAQGLVHALAWKLHQRLPKHVDLNDLIGYGQVGLAEAARDFDPSRGLQFSTFAYYRVRGAILDGLAKMSWFSRSSSFRGDYEQVANEVLEQSASEPATPADSSESKDAADVRWLKGLTGALARVHLFCQGSKEEDTASTIADDEAPPVAVVIQRETQARVRELIDALPAQEATLIRAAYFEGLSLKDAGLRIGISRAWASRLHAQTLKKLAATMRQAALADE